MRKIILLTFVSATFILKAQTSIYHHFPDSAATWNFHSSVAMSLCGPPVDQYYSITITGDTIISGKTYHKLFTPFVQVVPSFCTGIPAGYKGAVRQDTLLKKVFFVPPTNSSEQLLYDFTMQVGDTVKGYLESSAMPVDTIQSIDSVLVGTSYRKRWNLSSFYYIHFIEGVGSTYGLIEKSPGQTVDFPDLSLTCFMQNGQTLYPTTSTNCYLINSTAALRSNLEQITIYPNPAKDEAILVSSVHEPFTFEIHDMNGKLFFSSQTFGNSSIPLTNFDSGVYTLIIRTADRTTQKKLVVIR